MAGPECTACTASACSDAHATCAASSACSSWQVCASACADAACLRDCDEQHAEAALMIAAIYACGCEACEAECAAAGACDQTCPGGAGLGVANAPPPNLAETGLYEQSTDGSWQLAPHVHEFQPEFKLYSGDAQKTRWIYLPPCETVDTEDMDHWDFPVGTRLWKEFAIDGSRVETRFLHRYGEGVDQWLMVSYQWPEADLGNASDVDPELALLASAVGVPDANGTLHDIPSQADCLNCHGKLSERVLGFSALQLSHDLPGLNLADLVDWGVLSQPPSSSGAGMADYDPPGDETARAALGYLHANCGNCHNETGVASTSGTQPQSLWLRLLVGHDSVEETHAYVTAVNQETANPNYGGLERIDPTTPSNSVILTRIDNDVAGERMPPMRETIDQDGHGVVQAWVEALE